MSFVNRARATRRALFATFALAGVSFAVATQTRAQRFDPINAAPSLGAFPQTPGTYSFSTSGTPIWITNPNGSVTYTLRPVLTGPNNYKKYGVFQNGCALFAWDSITVRSDQLFIGVGPKPLVLLSRSGVLVQAGGRISLDGDSGAYCAVGTTVAAGGAGGFAGGTAGGYSGNTYVAAGAGYGPYGNTANGGGGSAYPFTSGPNPATSLSGGSGARGSDGRCGGAGGGALEISAASYIHVYGSGNSLYPAISARGGNGQGGGTENSHGGAGGTIYLTAPTVYRFGALEEAFSVAGGRAYFDSLLQNGGPGWGGRMRVEYSGATYSQSYNSVWTRQGEHVGDPTNSYSNAAPGELVIAPY